jgi:hypothetical protein
MLQLLRADSWHYMRAKRWHLLRIAGTLLLAAAAPVITFWWPEAADGVAAAAGAWVLVGRTVLSVAEQREIRLGVTIQEEFDTDLFRLEWNSSLAGPKAAPEDVLNAARRVPADAGLRDWYADTTDVPWPLDVLLCQRSSAVWGRRAHFAYGVTVLAIGVAWLLAGIIVGIAAHLSLGDYLLKLFLPSQPAFLDTIDLYRSHLRQSSDKGAVEAAADGLWAAGATDRSAVTAADCRHLQDEAYRLRRYGPQIPQWFYKLRRGSDEQAMRDAVAHLISQLPSSTRR